MEYLFECSTRDIELNTRRGIPYLQATMYDSVYYINILLSRKSRLNSLFKKRARCYSVITLKEGATCQQLIGYLKHTWHSSLNLRIGVCVCFISLVTISLLHLSSCVALLGGHFMTYIVCISITNDIEVESKFEVTLCDSYLRTFAPKMFPRSDFF